MPTYNSFVRDNQQRPDPAGLVALGPTLPVEVQVPSAIADVLLREGRPVPAGVAGIALIDTGASMTCVDEPVLTGLGLNPISAVSTGTAGGPRQQSVYPARLFFPSLQGASIDLAGVIGVDLSGQTVELDPPQPLTVLIGRNLMVNWTFIWNGPGGHWTICV